MKQKTSLQQQLYTVAFVDLSIKNVLDSTSLFHRPEWMDTMFLLIFFGCIGWKLMLQRYTKPMLLETAILGMLFTFVSFRMKYFYLLFTFCSVVAAQNINLKQVLKYTSITKILMLLLHVVPYLVTIIVTPEQIDYIYRNGVQRHYFYVGHPNTFSMYVVWALLEFMYAFYGQLRNVHLLLIWILNFIVYKYTDSNTGLIVMTICVAGFLAERAKPQFMAKILTPLARYSFAFCSIFFTVITMWFTSMPPVIRELYLKLNDFFTGRLLFGAFAYENFGIAWLGNLNVHLSKTTYFEGFWVDTLVFDNAYIYLLVYYGAIFLPIFSLAFILIGKDQEHNVRRNVEKILLVGYAFYAIMENYAINSVLCFPILFVGSRMYEMYEEKQQAKKLQSEKPQKRRAV